MNEIDKILMESDISEARLIAIFGCILAGVALVIALAAISIATAT